MTFNKTELKVIDKAILNFMDDLSLLWVDKPLDGDETQYIAESVEEELNARSGNQ